MKYNVNDVITLGTKDKYVIVNIISFNNINYYYIVLLNENMKTVSNICKIVKIKNEELDSIELVNDKEEFKKVIPLFMKSYQEKAVGDE